MMKGTQRVTTRDWVVGAFLAGALVWVMSRTLTTVPGVDLGTTARWSFVLFWLGSTGGALARLFGKRFEGLARRGRDLCLAYASAQLVHLAIVARVIYTAPPGQSSSDMLFFEAAVVWTYLLAYFSITKSSNRLHPLLWRIMRTVGTEWIAFAFLIDFARSPFDGVYRSFYYGAFLVFAVAAPLLRLAALVKRSIARKRGAPPRAGTIGLT